MPNKSPSKKKMLQQFVGFHERLDDFTWVVDWRSMGLPNCHVYVVGPKEDRPVKVGVSVDGLSRLSGLQTGNWVDLYVRKARWAESVADARRLEKMTHDSLRGKNLSGEWFDVTSEEAVDRLDWIAQSYDIALHSQIPGQIRDAVFDNIRARVVAEYDLGSEMHLAIRAERLKEFGVSRAVSDALRAREFEYETPSDKPYRERFDIGD